MVKHRYEDPPVALLVQGGCSNPATVNLCHVLARPHLLGTQIILKLSLQKIKVWGFFQLAEWAIWHMGGEVLQPTSSQYSETAAYLGKI